MRLEEYLTKLEELHKDCDYYLPRQYYFAIANSWFNDIAPKKAEEYGIECWEKVGVRGLCVNVSGCRFRWQSLVKKYGWTMNETMFDCLVDAFGYAMIFHVYFGKRVAEAPRLYDPVAMDEYILDNVWHKNIPFGDEHYAALCAAYSMWRLVAAAE